MYWVSSINRLHVEQVENQDLMILISQASARVITRTDITGLTLEWHKCRWKSQSFNAV